MNKGIIWALIAMTGVLSVLGQVGCRPSYAKALEEAFNNLDLQKNTKLHVEEYWKTINNQERTCEGLVVDVQRNRSGTEVFVAVPSLITPRDYNVVLTVSDVAQAAALKRGQNIRFKGTLSNYKAGRDGGVILSFRGGAILK